MALLTLQTIPRTGALPTYAAVSASDTVAIGSNTFLHVKNGGGSSDTVTITAAGADPSDADLLLRDRTVAVPNASERIIPLGATGPGRYRNPSTGVATITHSFTTSVTIAVIDMP